MTEALVKVLRVRCAECGHVAILRSTDVMLDRLKTSVLGKLVDDLVLGANCKRCGSHKLSSPRRPA